MRRIRTIDDLDVEGRRAIVRLDLNVPVKNGEVTDSTRIERSLPTLRELLDKGASIVVLSHFGRPDGKVDPELSLRPIGHALARAIGRPVIFVATDWQNDAAHRAAENLHPGQILLPENTRFHPGEEDNDPLFARVLAALGDIYINDAFSAAHRAHASTEGIAHERPSAAGRAMEAEIAALTRALENPERPLLAIIGGAKISTKLDLLSNLIAKVDTLVVGGAMANTFLAAQGRNIGKSLLERDLLDTARDILQRAAARDMSVELPVDAVLARAPIAGIASRTVGLDDVKPDEMILDIGPETVAAVRSALDGASTLVWNGPVGAFEIEPFDKATIALARHAAERTKNGKLVSIAGGGDTVAALNKAGVAGDFSYVSTAGGAFLEWLEGKTLPGVKVLEVKIVERERGRR
jgi:phosphoglycerate kinase